MNRCNYCGVELDAEMNFCPLCGHKSNSPVSQDSRAHLREKKDIMPEAQGFDELTSEQKQKLAWEISSVAMGLGVLVAVIIDFLLNKQIEWSKYPLVIGATVFANITLITFLQKKLLLMLTGCFVFTSLLLLVLDVFANNLGWGATLGIPIIFFFYLVVYFLVLLIRKSRQKGLNIVAGFLMAATILCMCIEGIVSLHVVEYLLLRWSIIVLVSVVPVSAILLYVHYRLKRVTDLKKFFHI